MVDSGPDTDECLSSLIFDWLHWLGYRNFKGIEKVDSLRGIPVSQVKRFDVIPLEGEGRLELANHKIRQLDQLRT
jgi:hypothetical protein